MHPQRWSFFASTLFSYIGVVLSLGTACPSPLGAGTAAAGDSFWLQNIKHQGTSAHHANPSSYKVFRNVKDYGAKGDGVADDTEAIKQENSSKTFRDLELTNAISSGGRCGGGTCGSSTLTPAVVYFPQGAYLVSSPIIAYYYTQLIGDARHPPTLLAASSFTGMAVIDVDPYIPGGGGAQWYINQDNFFRSVRNFIIDLRQIPATSSGTGIHWQVSQATSLINIVFQMSAASNTAHQGIWMENGSGGFMGDLVFNGGKYGMWVGNQQFTVRNITVNNAQSAVYMNWNWGWTFQSVYINNCQVGFDLNTGGTRGGTQAAGSIAIIDATVTNTGVFVRTSTASNGALSGSIVLNNARLTNTPTAVGVTSGAVVLAGGTTTISSWGQGNVYSGTSSFGSFIQGNIVSANKPSVLLDSSGKVFGKTHPQYANYDVSQFVSVKSKGAVGDGVTDDTAALKNIFHKACPLITDYAGCAIIFFDAGAYVVTSTLTIPAGTQIVGEAWSVVAGRGSFFQNVNSPQPVVRIGAPNSQGVIEISDIIFTTIGPTPGAIVVEWNVKQPSNQNGGAGMWDSHIILGGMAGTNMQTSQCPSSGSGGISPCMAAFLGLHLTSASTAYLEGTWVWLADHDLDDANSQQITVYSGRGILSESAGPVWMVGTAEHHVLYQYNIVNAKNHYLGMIQTESPYYQPTPAPPSPVSTTSSYHDPTTFGAHTWALWVQSSSDIIVFGAGLYSFYQDYDQTCSNTESCQSEIVNVDTTSHITIYGLSTVGTTYQLSVNAEGVIDQSSNSNGFASTVTAWG
ncbi:glycoside hydrolase family 55 protein [Amanita muscaria Koide BX008]|uniref:Glycoside hydrolase family 55 protein n=1 Tax=Amanita muscaria (strain Koide BX008) TaxID=946122 RepID=A0A0C2X3H1_AMAMK|nr:glycoside hydrolase family 55 protein [Amanita muscaria Koide BX008]